MKIIIEKIDKDNFIDFKVVDGDNYIYYYIDDLKDAHLSCGRVNGVYITSDNCGDIGFKKSGRKGRIEWCFENVRKINGFVQEKMTIENIKKILSGKEWE